MRLVSPDPCARPMAECQSWAPVEAKHLWTSVPPLLWGSQGQGCTRGSPRGSHPRPSTGVLASQIPHESEFPVGTKTEQPNNV